MTTTDTAPATVKDAAAAIRRDLKSAFPATKFSVRMGTGTASTWIDVKWTDGPNDDMVSDITDQYVKGPVTGVAWERHFSLATRLAAQAPAIRIEVAKSRIYSDLTRRSTPYYECTGPDGTRFDNTSIRTLRDVLKRRYGRVELHITEG